MINTSKKSNILNSGENDEVVFEIKNNSIVIPPKKKKIDELIAGYTGNYSPYEMDWGSDIGNEIW